ncbi:MAG TPA: Rad52/Rad22 family DNA repair protein [Coleofasciculaceae cyanobacterium]
MLVSTYRDRSSPDAARLDPALLTEDSSRTAYLESTMDIRDIITQLKAWFPPEVHKERDLPGGGKWFYIPWQLIRERFDEVCPDWEVSYSAPSYLGDYCAITCTITIGSISKQGVGNADIMLLSSSGKNMARGTPIERATADAFKNAAEAWGVGRYLDEQTDPKTKADFVRYMQHAGDGRAADFHHRNQGNLPQRSPASSKIQAKPFGQSPRRSREISREEWESKRQQVG